MPSLRVQITITRIFFRIVFVNLVDQLVKVFGVVEVGAKKKAKAKSKGKTGDLLSCLFLSFTE